MARTKQTCRRAPDGKAPRKVASKTPKKPSEEENPASKTPKIIILKKPSEEKKPALENQD